MFRYFKFILFPLMFLVFATPVRALTIDCSTGFSSLEPGIDYKNVTVSSPRNINVYIVRANLKQPGLQLVVTPRDSLGSITSDFFNKFNVDVAVNANPWTSPDLAGLNGYMAAVSAGDAYATSKEGSSLFVDKNNNANIDYIYSIPQAAWNLISGFQEIMKDGVLNPSIATCKDAAHCTTVTSRTAVGLTNDNQLIIMVVEQATLPEMAQIMTSCNAPTSLNLDGGGSSTMVVKNQGVVNHPTDGQERLVANHLGICINCQSSSNPVTGYYCNTTQKLCLACHSEDTNSECSPSPEYSAANYGECSSACSTQPPTNSCSNTTDPEFHSLRPYPFNSCVATTAKYATFCGNNLTIEDSINESYPGGGNCTTTNGTVICNYNTSVSKSISIDLKGANLPFMGNTEDVKNSINKSDTTSADKVNNYVSWYLNGTNNRAETGGVPSSSDLTNYSGPINKLLPGAILDAQRIKSIDNVTAGTNHNQIVVCANSGIPIVGNFLDLGHFTPIDCYNGDGSKAQGQKFRLKSDGILPIENTPIFKSIFGGSYGWDGSLSWIRTISNFAPLAEKTILDTLIKNLPSLPKSVIQGAIDDSITTAWNKKTPPLPWDNGTGKPFADELFYQKAYSEWKGNTCVVIPIISKLFCFDNWFIPNKYADLYPYIPLSSTEDLQGNIEVNSAAGSTTNGTTTVTDVSFSNQTSATLFFPHVEESNELGTLLQTTYVPKGQAYIGSPTETSNETSCNPVEVRSNKGDSITNGSSIISGNLSYNASFSCNFKPNTCASSVPATNCNELTGSCYQTDSNWSCGTPMGQLDCPSGYSCGRECSCNPPTQSCQKVINISLSTQLNAPKLDDVWSQLVAGPMAVVKRLFPKLGSQLGTLEDIPGSTSITYSGSANTNATLNIPHVGGIDEYFLNGIQTLLRPKGFGEPITFGPKTTTSSGCSGGTMPTLPKGLDYCTLKSTDTLPGSSPMPPTFKTILEAAGQTYSVPPSLILAVMYGEGAFNPGRYDWTDANVKAWSCGSVPNCNSTVFPSQGAVDFDESEWNSVKDAVKSVDPTREPNPCNLMDNIFAVAKELQTSKYGSPAFKDTVLNKNRTCYGIYLNSENSSANSCDWNPSDIETAIRIWEFGTAYNSTATCATLRGSCATGGGFGAACPGGDNCEVVGGSGNTSHNACLWDVTHNY